MELVSRECDVLGTKVWINVACEKKQMKLVEKQIGKAFFRAKEIEKKYSRFLKGNVLADLNSKVGEWVKVDEETLGLLKFGEDLKKKTDGVFDMSVKGILESWGYDAEYSFEEKGEGKLGEVKFADDGKVKISAEIEFGGIGKGYAVDEMAKFLEDFSGLFINAGGDIFAKGLNENSEEWKVYFEHPTDPEQVIGFVNVDKAGRGLACTSPSKRKWKNKHHLVNPKTKKPANEMLAVYTQAENCSLADAYATALFVMGYKVAKERLEDLPIEAMIVDVSGAIYRTEKFCGDLFVRKEM
ncbi:MAG: FAD:protein FMN transferase [Candidatus Peregrinibacteria bacterium]|nr:FAD:protein FMN transferase [Candidatus Peregrinibacteria bacterium]